MSALQIIDSSGWYMISTDTSKNFYDRVQELCADPSDNVVIYRTAYYYPEPWKIADGSFNASNWFQVTDINLPNLYKMSPSLGYWVLIQQYTPAAEYYKNAAYHIYASYPYDGSKAEKLEWHNASSDLENYIFEIEILNKCKEMNL